MYSISKTHTVSSVDLDHMIKNIVNFKKSKIKINSRIPNHIVQNLIQKEVIERHDKSKLWYQIISEVVYHTS